MSRKIIAFVNIVIVIAFVGILAAFAQEADSTPPVISAVVTSSIGETSATVTWTTNEPADSQAEYGTTTAYGLSSALQTATMTAHAVSLTGLTASTTYHFLVKSRDAAGNLATSSDGTFTTLAEPATTTPPVVGDVTVKVSVEPKTLNAKSKGKWIQVQVRFPEAYNARDVDLSTVKLNGTISPDRVKMKAKKEKKNGDDDESDDRESRLHLKFSRRAMIELLAGQATTTATTTTPVVSKTITISGNIGGKTFSGTAMVRFLAANDLPDGTLLRSADGSEVYVIIKGKKRHIPTAEAFEEAGYKWGKIAVISREAVEAYEEDVLIRSSDSPAVYLVSGGKKRHVTDPSEFEALGLDWEDITVVTPKEISHWDTVTNITLIRAAGDSKVYFISGGKKQWVRSETVFIKRGFKWEDIVIVDESEKDKYPAGAELD